MDAALITQLKILRMNESRPNFSELARLYDVDRRTVKKYYDGYSGKPAHHNKPSRLDKYETLIMIQHHSYGLHFVGWIFVLLFSHKFFVPRSEIVDSGNI